MSLTLLVSLLGQEGSPRTPVWIPNSKQRIAVLRRVIQAKLFQKQSKCSRKVPPGNDPKLRLFFNGHELQDNYSIEDYDLQDGHVIQVKADEVTKSCPEPDELHLNDHPTYDLESQLPKDHQPQLTSDHFYALHDHIDALDDTTGAWFPAQITSICATDDPTNPTYLITYRKPSLGCLIHRDLTQIRPQSYQKVTFPDLYPGQSVLVLLDKLWYVALVERIHQDYRYSRVSCGKIWLSLVRGGGGLGATGTILEQHVIKYKQGNILKLEQNVPRAQRDPELEEIIKAGCKTKRFYDPDCTACLDDHQVTSCSTCGCQVCSSKDSPQSQLLCDECDRSTHLWCLQTPLTTLPSDPDWYCDGCRNPSDQDLARIRRDHFDAKRRHSVAEKATNSAAGYGMSIAGRKSRSKTVPVGIFGSIEGVPVGAWWRFRAQVAERGVHCPLVSGIHGKATVGAYSIVFSGTYPEDVDLGDDLYYTATGGRQPGKSRTSSALVKDQELTKGNKALALNCAAPFTGVGASSGPNWRTGRPVRVLRSGNGRGSSRSSPYLPQIGIRYDGLYKVVKYWKEESSGSLVLWRFHLKRDDQSPAPWTEAGRYQAKKNGYLTPRYPDGWSLEMAGKRQLKVDLKYIEKRSKKDVKILENSQLPKADSFLIPESILSLINQDQANANKWTDLLNLAKDKGKTAFFTSLSETFLCICCMEQLFQEPVTLPNCSHSFCRPCLSRAITESTLDSCPMCRSTLLISGGSSKGIPSLVTNHILEQILVQLQEIK